MYPKLPNQVSVEEYTVSNLSLLQAVLQKRKLTSILKFMDIFCDKMQQDLMDEDVFKILLDILSHCPQKLYLQIYSTTL